MTEHPDAGHVDLSTLAEVEEGTAGTQVEVAARTHLEGCQTCRDRLSRLRTTRALLTTLPAEAMPDDVRDRVDAALARTAAEQPRTVVPLARRSRPWNSPAVAGGAAAAAVVVLVAALVAGNVIHRKHSTSSSSLGTNAPTSAAAGNKAGGTLEWATGTNYTPATMATLVPRLLTGTPGPIYSQNQPAATPTPETTTSARATNGFTADQLRASPQAVLACGAVLGGGIATTPVAVDFARFEGKPAVIFALPAIGHPALLDVWVVRSTCSASSLDLYFQRVPRSG